MVTDKEGRIFEDRRKLERRKESVKVNEDRRISERRNASSIDKK